MLKFRVNAYWLFFVGALCHPLAFGVGLGGPVTSAPKPKLLVVIAIDQFRSDYLQRFKSRFLPAQTGSRVGGFNYLLSNGAYFPWAEYEIIHSITGPGHATLLTGSYPYQNGIALNDWFDQTTGQKMYCTEDPMVETVGATPKNKHVGTSPKNLIGTTVGDELKNAGYPSHSVSIALKDRAAILMGGHRADLALWMDKESRHWVSSAHYLPNKKLPAWIDQLNRDLDAQDEEVIDWTAPATQTGYSAADSLALTDDRNAGKIGRQFPHQLAKKSSSALALPFGAHITELAVEAAVIAESLGAHAATDLLTVSFSSHDYLGHAFGPNSREMEEMTVEEDKVLAKLFNFLQKKVPGGLNNTLIVLTADHGIPPNPDWLNANKISAGRIDDSALRKTLEESLAKKWGKPGKDKNYIAYEDDLEFFFDREVLEKKKAPLNEVSEMVKTALLAQAGIAFVFTREEYNSGEIPPGIHSRQILNTYNLKRSGDLVAIPEPFYFAGGSTVTHATGYAYDRMVPLLFKGAAFQKGTYAQAAKVVDLAPTLSFILGVTPPALSEGRVLWEALK